MNYYCAREHAFGFTARIYKFDSTGNKEIKIWESERVYTTREEAEDAACEYSEENNIDTELE